MPREVFVAGQVLTAAELNVVSDQSVMVFAGTAARGSAIPSPSEGMVTYLSDADELQVYTTDWGGVGGGKILQVVSAVKTDTFTSSSASFVDVTGLSATITPSSASNKVLVLAQINNSGYVGHYKIVGGNSAAYVGNTSGSRIPAVFGGFVASSNSFSVSDSINYLDSPATTSATTYKVQVFVGSAGGGTAAVNRASQSDDNNSNHTGASSITLMEVAG